MRPRRTLLQEGTRALQAVAAALQLLGDLLVRPSAWHRLVTDIDPTLSDGFSLLYLSRDTLKHPTLRRILFLGFCVLPLCAVLVEQLLRLAADPQPLTLTRLATDYALNALAKLAGMLRIGGILAVFFSVGAGIVSMIVDILVNEAIHQYFSFFMKDVPVHSTTESGFVQSYPGLCIAIFSFCAGFISYLQLSQSTSRPYSSVRSSGAVIVGLFLVISCSLIAVFAVKRFPIQNNVGVSLLIIVIFSAMVGMGFRLHGRPWQLGFRRCLWFLVTYLFLLFVGTYVAKVITLFHASEGLLGTMPSAALSGLRAVITNCFLFLLLIPVVHGEWLGGAGAAAVAGGLGAPLCWLIVTIGTDVTWGSRTPTEQWATILLAIACMATGSTLPLWRRYLFFPFEAAWNQLLFRFDLRRGSAQCSFLRWNSAFWDERQTLRSDTLVEHLVYVISRWPHTGEELVKQVAAGPQRWAAQAALLEQELQHLEGCQDMAELAQIHARLGAMSMFGEGMDTLRTFSRLSQDVSAAMTQSNPYHHRIALRIVEEHMDRLTRDWRLSDEPLATRCLRIVYRWRDLYQAYQSQLQREASSLTSAYIESPYVIGLPLSEHQHVFVGRTDVGVHIEKLIMSPTAPPLLLYGQRRMGKTSLLRNLRRMLPSTWVTLFVDLQALASAEGHAGFLFQLARTLSAQLSGEQRTAIEFPSLEELNVEPFIVFDVWLDRLLHRLQERSALLLLDEFEQLDIALRAGTLNPHLVLGMLRHIIQHKPQLRILVAGSHTFEEATTWSSYLINARVIKLGCLRRDESQQLIERPTPNFALRYEPAALEVLLALTGGHPYLLQLLCDRVVELKNQQPEQVRFLTTPEDVEAAVAPALFEASFFFAELIANQISPQGHAALRVLARRGPGEALRLGALPLVSGGDELQVWSQLQRRDLVELSSDGYRFQNELIRRYFATAVSSLELNPC